ncbi:NAD(P)H-dependent oxidoreductase [Amphritea pacifica]|uniref:NAD(P)H-dependent oxidoreductase n=1 Tax=Amphritea pacifica TaxID=2811233 RepID=A0ABS2WD57_9GAMM|nr:NAD(P)H-dependent oxidoreductase [Amphritea pacifica]MBN0989511.1 NAD(P)H-dependent oxidoreductase [Amphritea pacifica]MBN1005083.1 NAD(P)H-dependent oxidoreductase [Amphritea pacifica]
MKHKRIFILNGHPAQESLSKTLLESYAHAAREAGHEVRMAHLHDMKFDSDYGFAGYTTYKPLEPVLEKVLSDLEWCEHLVMSTPLWWGGIPAKLKGLFDRAFLPGRVFDTQVTKFGIPSPMLSGRTARVIVTSDTPNLFMRLFYKNALHHQLRKQIFGFIGFKPTRIIQFSSASHAKPAAVERWLKQVRKLGACAS